MLTAAGVAGRCEMQLYRLINISLHDVGKLFSLYYYVRYLQCFLLL